MKPNQYDIKNKTFFWHCKRYHCHLPSPRFLRRGQRPRPTAMATKQKSMTPREKLDIIKAFEKLPHMISIDCGRLQGNNLLLYPWDWLCFALISMLLLLHKVQAWVWDLDFCSNRCVALISVALISMFHCISDCTTRKSMWLKENMGSARLGGSQTKKVTLNYKHPYSDKFVDALKALNALQKPMHT